MARAFSYVYPCSLSACRLVSDPDRGTWAAFLFTVGGALRGSFGPTLDRPEVNRPLKLRSSHEHPWCVRKIARCNCARLGCRKTDVVAMSRRFCAQKDRVGTFGGHHVLKIKGRPLKLALSNQAQWRVGGQRPVSACGRGADFQLAQRVDHFAVGHFRLDPLAEALAHDLDWIQIGTAVAPVGPGPRGKSQFRYGIQASAMIDESHTSIARASGCDRSVSISKFGRNSTCRRASSAQPWFGPAFVGASTMFSPLPLPRMFP